MVFRGSVLKAVPVKLFVLLIYAAFLLCPLEVNAQSPLDDPSSWIGLTITEVLERFGVPSYVYPVRGLMEWQDDVVFAYTEGDFYLYRDRVWQVCVKSAKGINFGDPAGVASLILGSRAETRGGSIFCSLYERGWPLELRCDTDEAGRVKAIFIYRPDL